MLIMTKRRNWGENTDAILYPPKMSMNTKAYAIALLEPVRHQSTLGATLLSGNTVYTEFILFCIYAVGSTFTVISVIC